MKTTQTATSPTGKNADPKKPAGVEPKVISRWEGEGGANPTGPATSNSEAPSRKQREGTRGEELTGTEPLISAHFRL